jgi:hypothetical protein
MLPLETKQSGGKLLHHSDPGGVGVFLEEAPRSRKRDIVLGTWNVRSLNNPIKKEAIPENIFEDGYIGNITEKSRKMIHVLGKTVKLNWGLGHKALKIIYKGAIVPLMTYGAPVWEEAVKKQTLLRKLQSTQRLINIKISKSYRTISYEASCVMAGGP